MSGRRRFFRRPAHPRPLEVLGALRGSAVILFIVVRLILRPWGLSRYLRLVGLGLSLLLAALVSGFVAMRFAIRGTVVNIPNVVGMTTGEASHSLQRVGLAMKVLAKKPSPGNPANVVLVQQPIAGTPVKPDQMVRVILSSGDRKEAVPDVVGSSLRVAQMTLVSSGHALGDVSRIHYGPENASQIMMQLPTPQESSGLSTTVHVLLNLGAAEDTYVMPELVGRDINDAIRFFDRNGIKIQSVNYRPSSGMGKGIILMQDPERGHRLGPQTAVKLEVSR